MSEKPCLRIAIIGAGIGGLSLSAGLGHMAKERNLEINIYEAASRISEIGAGINVWPRTWSIYKSLGLEDVLLPLLPEKPNDSMRVYFKVRKSDQPKGVHIQDLKMKGGALRFHRAQLQRALLSRMHGQLHLSHRLVSYEETEDEVTLEFANGVKATCDLLVAYDGINSTVRRCFLSKHGKADSPSVNPVWSGDTAYRTLVDADVLEANFPGHRALTNPVMYTGKGKHLIVYPVSNDKLVNFIMCTKDLSKNGTLFDGPIASTCPKEELLDQLPNWEPEVQALVKSSEKMTKWIIRSLVPLEKYASGRVALCGDAAHAMTPHQGMGAGQAIEDAYILGSLLAQKISNADMVSKVTEIYNAIRCPIGNMALEKSRRCGNLCQLLGPGFGNVKDGDANLPRWKLLRITKGYDKELEWVWKESADIDRARALAMLSSSQGV
ncbi:hypothetical protein D9613_012306 [Agrocybe pediades]|uniref:FAD-binding domain-containing protein n=1 Tax=Agrocybe pediades TaxID=84607 RepID=A0A8H4VHQ9_9AGAR|nr:hypothetical protein D9613_012306 [Agrocybe pediades]